MDGLLRSRTCAGRRCLRAGTGLAVALGLLLWTGVLAAADKQAPQAAAADEMLASFARSQWDASKWAAVRLPHMKEARAFVQRDESLGTEAFTPEEIKGESDHVLLLTDTKVVEGEFEVVFSLSEAKGTAPGLFLSPVVKDGVVEKAFTLFVASYTMAFWRAETDPQTGRTSYPPLARLNCWQEPNQKHVLRCRFSKARNAFLVRLDQGDTIMLKDVGVEVNSLIGIWGCHGPCDFHQIRMVSKPELEWSATILAGGRAVARSLW